MEVNVALNRNQKKSLTEDEVNELKERLKRYELEMASLIRATEIVRAEAEQHLSQKNFIGKIGDSRKKQEISNIVTSFIEKGRLYDDREVAELVNAAAQNFNTKITLFIESILQSKSLLGKKIVSERLMAKWLEEAEIFDQDYYLSTNEDVRRHGSDPIFHYIKHGRREGRRPGPLFK